MACAWLRRLVLVFPASALTEVRTRRRLSPEVEEVVEGNPRRRAVLVTRAAAAMVEMAQRLRLPERQSPMVGVAVGLRGLPHQLRALVVLAVEGPVVATKLGVMAGMEQTVLVVVAADAVV